MNPWMMRAFPLLPCFPCDNTPLAVASTLGDNLQALEGQRPDLTIYPLSSFLSGPLQSLNLILMRGKVALSPLS